MEQACRGISVQIWFDDKSVRKYLAMELFYKKEMKAYRQ